MTPQLYYASQSKFSDPGQYASLFDDLPNDIAALCHIVQTIYIHYRGGKMFNSAVPEERKCEVDTRYMELILKRITELDNRPLIEPRPPERRFVGCCRDASLLLCSMLRHKGIPARTRVGFATYIAAAGTDFNADHVVTEYWDAQTARWKLVDAEQSNKLIEINQITFDVHDMPRERFLVGGAAWQRYRFEKADLECFGNSRDDFFKGAWAIRNRLIQDLATLNKVELLLWDTWQWGDYGVVLTDDDLHVLDGIAALTQGGDSAYTSYRTIYEADERLKAPNRMMSYSPIVEPHEVVIP